MPPISRIKYSPIFQNGRLFSLFFDNLIDKVHCSVDSIVVAFPLRSEHHQVEFLKSKQYVLLTYHCVKSVRIRSFCGSYFPTFGLIRRGTEYLAIFSPNVGKYGPEKLPIRTLFTQCISSKYSTFLNPENQKFSDVFRWL